MRAAQHGRFAGLRIGRGFFFANRPKLPCIFSLFHLDEHYRLDSTPCGLEPCGLPATRFSLSILFLRFDFEVISLTIPTCAEVTRSTRLHDLIPKVALQLQQWHRFQVKPLPGRLFSLACSCIIYGR